MLPDLALLSTLTDSNYPCVELIFMVPKGVRAIEVRLYLGLTQAYRHIYISLPIYLHSVLTSHVTHIRMRKKARWSIHPLYLTHTSGKHMILWLTHVCEVTTTWSNHLLDILHTSDLCSTPVYRRMCNLGHMVYP